MFEARNWLVDSTRHMQVHTNPKSTFEHACRRETSPGAQPALPVEVQAYKASTTTPADPALASSCSRSVCAGSSMQHTAKGDGGEGGGGCEGWSSGGEVRTSQMDAQKIS
ncbi:hypothetical protein BDA96_01G479500 [Sorghum bicolor]|uniref:Uncharacterized protein n=1 Tax=Sorghum bicolor TaxID=4558 RepID=A0A921S7U0_SORBI|nr:hypothetical protein BDA96_01G479500 [Sorghum bicolor]